MSQSESTIWVGGLPERVTEEEIRDVYEKYGEVKHVQVRYNTGKCSFAFVQFAVLADAEDAVKSTDQQKLFGMPFVKVAWPGQRQKGKGDGKGGRSRSPRRRSPSRRRRSPSQRRRSPSRRREPPSGYRRSPSPGRRRTPPRDGRSRSPRRLSREPQGRPGRTYRITVENLPKDMESRELKEFGNDFAKVGKCAFAAMIARGIGELDFTEIADMEKAIRDLDRRRFSGSDEKLKAYKSR